MELDLTVSLAAQYQILCERCSYLIWYWTWNVRFGLNAKECQLITSLVARSALDYLCQNTSPLLKIPKVLAVGGIYAK